MDASAYLRKQGWRGDGHSLDHTDRGIKKPLLVSKKVDVLGVGLNKHQAVSDQWWLRAFDQGLKSFGTGEETALSQIQKHGVNRGGLYANFVKGEQIPGSIGQSLLPTPDDSDHASKSKTAQAQAVPKSAVEIPPKDKLVRVVGSHENQHSHDAVMHLLQNPDEAPASIHKTLDLKRKRAERPAEKRARRKTERSQDDAKERKRQAIEDGTWDREQEQERRCKKKTKKQVKQFVVEAQRQGLIPTGPKEIRKGIVPDGANATPVQEVPMADMQQVFEQARLNTQVKFKGSDKDSLKAQKYERKKMKRELKRAAKAYLLGEDPPHEQTMEEKKAKKEKKRMRTARKKADAAEKDAERMATREKIDRHPAPKHGMSLEEYRKALEKGEVPTPKVEKRNLPPEKLAEYQKRADAKGIKLEEYIRRREEKQAAKQAEEMGNPFQKGIHAATRKKRR